MTKKKPVAAGKTICGIDLTEIRRSYFGGKLKDLFSKVQSETVWSETDVQELGNELERLRGEESKFVGNIRTGFSGALEGLDGENKPPTVDDLMEGVSDKDWREKADKAMSYVNDTLNKVREGIVNKTRFDPAFWLDQAQVFLSLLEILDRDRVFRDQLYRAKMTRIIDEFGVSRKEAEERAKLTPEYAEYKNATLLRERIDETINVFKKKDAENKPYA